MLQLLLRHPHHHASSPTTMMRHCSTTGRKGICCVFLPRQQKQYRPQYVRQFSILNKSSYEAFHPSSSSSCINNNIQSSIQPNMILQNRRRNFSQTTTTLNKKDKEEETTTKMSILSNPEIASKLPLQDIRNFCFVAHVDHGKSSLASRVLELTGNLGLATTETNETNATTDNKKEQIQLLDTLSVEQERGITVKSTAASMLYYAPTIATNPTGYLLLNMVDTPGHADFGLEVTRSLSSVQGAVLLLDATQGIQAQTLSVYEKATATGKHTKGGNKERVVIPALTKVDLESEKSLDVCLAVSELFGFDPDDITLTSARSRIGIDTILDKVCQQVPSPKELPDDDNKTLRAQLIDSWFEPLRGVVCLVQILSGSLSEGDRITIVQGKASTEDDGGSSTKTNHVYNAKETYSVQDIGIVTPKRIRTGFLNRGQMGYVIAGLRDTKQAQSGMTIVQQKELSKVLNMALPIMEEEGDEKSVLYASVHPMEGDGFDDLSNAVDRLALNDSGLEVHRTSGAASSADGGPFLGPGLRVGFQGLLHVEVFRQRLLDEFGLDAIVTPPKVPYIITYLASKSKPRAADAPDTEVVEDLSKWPSYGHRFKVQEPMVNVRIMAPVTYAGNVMELIKRKRGKDLNTKPIDETTWLFSSNMPWGEVVTDFHDELKNTTAGYASFDISDADPPHQEANLSKVDIMLNGDIVDPLAFVCHKDDAQAQARVVCKKLHEVLPRQQFVTVIQAKADGKIVASERIKAYRKNVLVTGGSKSVGGGDITRKKKLLEKQKKGKKRQQTSGKVSLSQAAFNSVISRS